jgi:NADPH-dependent glutamate synthase beta subunit-like oxidoreductase
VRAVQSKEGGGAMNKTLGQMAYEAYWDSWKKVDASLRNQKAWQAAAEAVVQALGPPVYVMPAGAEISKRPQPIIIDAGLTQKERAVIEAARAMAEELVGYAMSDGRKLSETEHRVVDTVTDLEEVER